MGTPLASKLIFDMALRVFSKGEFAQLPMRLRLGVIGAIGDRLRRSEVTPTDDELREIRDHVLDEAWQSGYSLPAELSGPTLNRRAGDLDP